MAHRPYTSKVALLFTRASQLTLPIPMCWSYHRHASLGNAKVLTQSGGFLSEIGLIRPANSCHSCTIRLYMFIMERYQSSRSLILAFPVGAGMSPIVHGRWHICTFTCHLECADSKPAPPHPFPSSHLRSRSLFSAQSNYTTTPGLVFGILDYINSEQW